MLKNFASLALFFIVSPSILAFSIFLAFENNNNQKLIKNYSSITSTELKIDNNIDGQVLGTQIDDIRPYAVASFLKGTPLEPYSSYIVEISDKYAIDYRLIPAIAMKESGGGAAIDQTTHNAWGWENGRTNFDSWEAAIDIVAKTLKEKYVAKGLISPEEIMTVYAPPQLLTGGKWAKDINYFFSQMEIL